MPVSTDFLHKVLVRPVVSFCAIFGAVFLFAFPVRAQDSLLAMVSAEFGIEALSGQSRFERTLAEGGFDGVAFEDPEGLRTFYAGRDGAPLWIKERGDKTARLRRLHKEIEKSWQHGLNPEHYYYTRMANLLEEEGGRERDDSLELLASDAVVRYVRDLTAMRVDPSYVNETFRERQRYLLTEDVLAFFERESDVSKALEAFIPKGNLYGQMQHELIRLVTEPEEPYEKVLPIPFTRILRPGDRDPSIERIRLRMGMELNDKENSRFYDDTLAQKVMAFQEQNGLSPDAKIGPRTLEIMNISRVEKIEQIVVNMERLRWVARDKPPRYILVNIPSATLWAIEDGQVVLDMPVVLGRKKRETESFITDIEGIRFNPNWTIPPTIKKEDYLPNLVEDPYYATKRGIEFVSGYGDAAVTIDPGTVDWAAITWQEFKDIRMIQAPGETNPLGQVRVLMPNKYNIYLHDTNHREDFAKPDRFLSSGCIRVEQPEALSNFIMSKNEGWNDPLLQDILRSGKLQEWKTAESLPVFILYQTVWLDQNGKIAYGSDVYGDDLKLIKHMKDRGLFAIPVFVKDEKPDNTVLKSLDTEREGVAPVRFNP